MSKKEEHQLVRRVLGSEDTEEVGEDEISEAVDQCVDRGVRPVELKPVTGYLSSGCTILDLAIAGRYPGGFGEGRITQIYGGESTGKSVIACEPLGAAQRRGGVGIFADAEFTFDQDRAELLYGLSTDPDEFYYYTPHTIEELFDGIIRDIYEVRVGVEEKGKKKSAKPSTKAVRTSPEEVGSGLVPWALAIDSLSALTSIQEEGEALGEASYQMSRAKAMSTAFRKYIARVNDANLACIFVDQTRSKVGGPGKGETTSAGRALKFYASTRVRLRHLGKIKNKYNKVVGVWISFQITKNKIAPPFREGAFRIMFDYGIDDLASNLSWLEDNWKGDDAPVSCSNKGGWWTFKSQEGVEVKAQGFEPFVRSVEEKEFTNEVLERTVERWGRVYEPTDRIPRVRE